MRKHGLPPLVGGFADGKVTWQRLDSIDYDTLGYLLSCHLIIEHYLDHFIATYANAPFEWEGAKLTFGQKISLISKLPIFKEPYNLPPTIKHLNSLRNKFSHNISTKLTEEDLLPFRQFLAKCTKKEAEIPTDAQDLLSFYTSIVCAYLASSISYSAQLMKKAKP
jgi:hypothetical protein